MTNGEIIVLLLFAGGLVCSITLLLWLRKLLKSGR